MKHLVRWTVFAPLCLGVGAASLISHQLIQVGGKSTKGTMVSTGQFLDPAGRIANFNTRPVDMVISPDGLWAYLKTSGGIVSVNCTTMAANSEIKIEGGDSFCGIVLSEDGKSLCYTTATNKIVVFDVDQANLKVRNTITLPPARVGGAPTPTGILFQDPSHVFVCLNRDNSIARVDLESSQIEKWDCDVAPFGIALDPRTQRLFVSCWARKAIGKELQALSAGTQVPVDERGVGIGGRLDEFDLRKHEMVNSTPIGHHASEVILDDNSLFVPCSGSDTVETFNLTSKTHKTIQLLPNRPIGAAPASIANSPDGKTSYIACSGRNSIVVFDRLAGKVMGEIPTAWYPVSVKLVGTDLFVACTKGLGERAIEKNPMSHNSWDLTGALCRIPISTKPLSIAIAPPPMGRATFKPMPIPLRSGEPSLFKHVVYVIRENRTYDQVFGDMKEGDGETSLCTFGEKITPNAHALAREFTLLDNFYCNGICSADGHSWATEGNTTANLERAVSSWPRSYPFGDDALNTSSTGFLWDEALAAKKSFLNFGEFDYASTANKETYFDCLKEHSAGTSTIKFKQNIGVARMKKYSAPGYPGWDLSIPDVLRADIFLRQLKQMESAGSMPDLTILYLCCDHTGGPVTARASVADNDLALGMCVEGLTKSKFWKDSCIFVEEDDPQAGWDHVDGHRSPCLVISPYSRNRGRVSDFYNQTSVVRSIEHILGLPTKSYFTSIAPLMTTCFGSNLDTTPFRSRPNQIPLDETKIQNYGRNFDLSKPDLIDDKKFNRAIWAETMPGKPYPADWEGGHGKGLAKRGLALFKRSQQSDD